jgi:pyruvate/2-oxoglutarate dehydrogenase complex dihydrolipoamide acyltransferase (E2) component
MAKIFNLPAVGDTMVEGEIVEWYVAVGDEVDLDQVICSLETDKSVVDMTTPHRGTVLQLGADVGGVVAVGSALLVVGEPGEPVPDMAPAQPAAPAALSTPPRPVPARAPLPSLESAGPGAPALILSPVVRRAAAEHGIDLTTIVGTGVGGRITRDDLETAVLSRTLSGLTGGGAQSAPLAPTPHPDGRVLAMPKIRKIAREQKVDLAKLVGSGARGSITLADLPAPPRGDRQRLSAMRRTIAQRLTESAQQIPQFTSMVDVDATVLLQRRADLRETLDAPLPLDALFVADTLAVLDEHPLMNARLIGDEVEYFDAFNIGIAVDTQDGLMVPVVKAADALSIEQLSAEIIRLAAAARGRTITPDELSDATCTINNVGALGILAGTPILPLETSTIVAFGASRQVLALVDGEVSERPVITISATFDHRLIDGGGSARFLQALVSRLERATT